METTEEAVEGGRHGCGKCFTSFATPELLQEHCLTCFGDLASNGESHSPPETEIESPAPTNGKHESFSITLDDEDDESLKVNPDQQHPAFDSIIARNNEPGGRCIQIVAGKKIMQCTLCFKTFTNYNSFKRHRRMHVSGASHTCSVCNKDFFRRYLWKNHMERNHGVTIDEQSNEVDNNYYLAPLKKIAKISQVAFPVAEQMEVDENANVLKTDLYADTPERPSSVPQMMSDKLDVSSTHSSPGPSLNISSVKKNSKSTAKVYRCQFCFVSFDEQDLLNAHLMSHGDDGTYMCYVCKFKTSDHLSLRNHFESNHASNFSDGLEDEEDSEIGDVSDAIIVRPESELKDLNKRLVCCVCKENFQLKEQFFKHMKGHMALFCDFCGRQFINQNEMLKHRVACTYSKNRSCHICHMQFGSVLRLKYHVFFHLSKPEAQSNVTIHQLINQQPLNEASKRVDSILRNKGLLQTRNEEPKIAFTKSIIPSNEKHSAISVTLTPVESHSTSSENDCDIKMANGSKACICDHCGIPFERQEQLQRHMIRDHVFKHAITTPKVMMKASASKTISCRKRIAIHCLDDVTLERTIDVQSLSSKTYTARFRCKLCPKKFRVLAGLNQHISEHFSPHFCKYCAMPFSEKLEMLAHTNIVHSRAQKYYCYTCCTNVNNSVELQNHISKCYGPALNEEQSSIMPNISVLPTQSFGTYKECKVCHKKFVNEKRLMNHTCVGSTEGKWSCDICNISFAQSSHLASHQQQAHRTDETFRCDVCGLCGPKEFVITHMITIHMTKVTPSQQSSLTITPINSTPPKVVNIDMPKNSNEIPMSSNFAQPSTSTHDFCAICNKQFTSAEFPEHMLREHCAGVKAIPSDDKTPNDNENVIEIITKNDDDDDDGDQLVR